MLNPMNAAEQGYAVVIQDCRGRFTSDGEWNPFHVEVHDGYDTVECSAQAALVERETGHIRFIS